MLDRNAFLTAGLCVFFAPVVLAALVEQNHAVVSGEDSEGEQWILCRAELDEGSDEEDGPVNEDLDAVDFGTLPGTPLLVSPVGAASAEGVDSPYARHEFSAVAEPLGDEIFLTGTDWNALAVDNQGIAALHDEHVFVEIMHMGRGACWFAAGPEGHLAAVYAGSRLTAGGDGVCRALYLRMCVGRGEEHSRGFQVGGKGAQPGMAVPRTQHFMLG